jgi:hypothetical protein
VHAIGEQFDGVENSKSSVPDPNIPFKKLTKYCLNPLKNQSYLAIFGQYLVVQYLELVCRQLPRLQKTDQKSRLFFSTPQTSQQAAPPKTQEMEFL